MKMMACYLALANYGSLSSDDNGDIGSVQGYPCLYDSDSDSDRILFNINRNQVSYIRLQE